MDGDLSSDKTMLIERILAAPHLNIPPCSERQAQGPRSGALYRRPIVWMRARRRDNGTGATYIGPMRTLIILALFALLGASVWFAGTAWERIGGDAIPFYGYVAIVGGVLFSLLLGGGLMALVFYSSRHGYDDLSGGDSERG
jgi:hypothetical protein